MGHEMFLWLCGCADVAFIFLFQFPFLCVCLCRCHLFVAFRHSHSHKCTTNIPWRMCFIQCVSTSDFLFGTICLTLQNKNESVPLFHGLTHLSFHSQIILFIWFFGFVSHLLVLFVSMLWWLEGLVWFIHLLASSKFISTFKSAICYSCISV